MIDLCLSALLVVQDPQPTPPKPEVQQQQPQAPAFVEWDDATARDAVRDFKRRMKGRDGSLKDRNDAVEALAKGRNDKLIDPLATVVLTEKSVVVRKAAAAALAHQPEPDAKRAILRLIGHDALKDLPQVQATLVESLSKAGYEPGRDWKTLDGLFQRDYSPERVPLQQAILALVEQHEELEALDLLIDNLGEPVPEDIHDASNPPAEYWEARWKSWSKWRGEVKDALLAITGQRFSTKEEARTWLKKNEAELRRKR